MWKFTFIYIICFTAFLSAQNKTEKSCDVFSFEKEVTLPGTSEIIYDALTGDISGWWDHSFKENPLKLFIEAKPGGGFWEIFDEDGNGALHATVIYAERGKMLRFDGPLGLSGTAINLVCTYSLEQAGKDSTKLKLQVHGSGEMEKNTPVIVENVWEHFIFERFVPYIKEGKHLE